MSSKFQDVTTCAVTSFPVHGRPLGHDDQAFVAAAIGDIAPDWSVELELGCLDDATLVALPADGGDELGPSFMICRDASGFRLGQVRWDTLSEVGVFASLDATVTTLRRCLALYSGYSPVRSMTMRSMTMH